MSDWELPTLAPPEYLDRKVQTNSESELNFYSAELGITNNLKRIIPNINSSRRFTGGFSPRNIPASYTDPPIVRSEAWSSLDFVRSSKRRRWIQFKSNFISCIKSVKCRFTALGLLLGLTLSLGAIIPIVIIWQKSISGDEKNIIINFFIISICTIVSASNPTSSSSNPAVGSSLNVSTTIGVCNAYFCEETVFFTTNMTITALSLVITVQRTENTTYYDTYNSNNAIINSTYTITTTEIIYTFFIENDQLLAGTNSCTAQFSLPDVNHTTSDDTYSIQTTNICGVINSASGNFP